MFHIPRSQILKVRVNGSSRAPTQMRTASQIALQMYFFFPSHRLLKLLEKTISYCKEVVFGHESLHSLINETLNAIIYSCLFLIIQIFTSVVDSSGTLS